MFQKVINRAKRQLQKTEFYSGKCRGGRPAEKTLANDCYLVNFCLRNRVYKTSQSSNDFDAAAKLTVSTKTNRNRLHRAILIARRPAQCIYYRFRLCNTVRDITHQLKLTMCELNSLRLTACRKTVLGYFQQYIISYYKICKNKTFFFFF